MSALATLALPVLIGAAGLAFDLNRGYEQRIVNQRAADMGALGAAMAFKETSDENILSAVARDLVVANGLTGAVTTAAVVNDFPNAGDRSVHVEVTASLPFTLARVVGLPSSFSVSSEAFATLTSSEQFAPPCYLALNGGKSAISVTGGASIDSPDCAIAAIGSIENKGQLIRGADIISGAGDIYVNHGALSANTLRFAGSFDKPQWNNNVPPQKDRINKPTSLVDPWAGDSELVSALGQLGTYAAPASIGDPVTPNGSDWSFDWSPGNPVKGFETGGGNFVVPPGNYNIRKLSVGGGINVTFQPGSRITVKNGVSIGGGSSVNFGDSDVYVNGGFDSGSSGVTFGNGVLWLGSGKINFSGTNRKGNGDVFINSTLSMGGGQSLTMGSGKHMFGGLDLGGGGSAAMGDGDFTSINGVKVSGGSELAVGNGNVRIGPGNGGTAIKLMGSARFFMGDGAVSVNGDIDTAGGSRIAFGKATNHYINGDMKIAGAALFGSGRYTVNGDFTNGTGGTTWPFTSSLTGKTYGGWLEGESVGGFDMAGIDVTFVLAGTMNLSGGAKTKLYAPRASIPGGQIADLLVATEDSSDANWTGGSVNAFAGTIYFPNAQVKMAGGNSSVSGSRCMTLIADTIRVNGGAATGSACEKMQGSAPGGGDEIRLVG